MARNKKRRRSAFSESSTAPPSAPEANETILADDPSPGLFGYMRNFGVRETIESLIIAVALALLFRAFEAEAFIIPTGSMAPSLNGQHIDLPCDNCGYQYHSGASDEADHLAKKLRVDSTRCPICRYETELRRFGSLADPNHGSNKGDRILVNKFIYDFQDPERFDVIVFKNPNNGKQNYIKRLIGLPGDNILIQNGDIYLMESTDGGWSKKIARKPARKLRHVLQPVADTYHIGNKLKAVDWPSRWQPFSDQSGWNIEDVDGNPTFEPKQTTESWLRYRHFQPLDSEWATIKQNELPRRYRGQLPEGMLINDYYGYNGSNVPTKFQPPSGLHWVGDIGLEAWLDVQNGEGEVLLDVVEGGVHFTCSIDVSTGVAKLKADDSAVEGSVEFVDAAGTGVAKPTAKTNLAGQGSYHIEFVNADDQIHLWINNRYIEFDGATYTRTGIPIPTYSANDPGDAEPLGVGAKDAQIKVTRLKVVRDIYYTSVKGGMESTANESNGDEDAIFQLQRNPKQWSTPTAILTFKAKKTQNQPMFELLDSPDDAKDQFLPMGDNSPRSLDGRVWSGPNYVERDLLIGRALFVYWPHSLNRPIPYFPNFGEMGFIR